MAKVTVMPMLGEVNHNDRGDLRGCWARTERKAVERFSSPVQYQTALLKCMGEILLTERPTAAGGKVTLIVEVEL